MARTHRRTFVWRFDQPPERIWPALADTARFNEAAGLPKHGIEEATQPDGSVRYFAKARKGPFRLAWEEIPVEWVDGQWFRHLREFSAGPIRSLCATLRLAPDDAGGAIGHYTIEARAANPLGEIILRTGFFPSARRLFTGLAESARDWAAGERERPFDMPPARLTPATRARLDALVQRIEAGENAHGLARRLGEWIVDGGEADLLRIRPLALAKTWGADPRETIEMCLQAVHEGLLEMRWDLLCPRCRGAKLTVRALDRLPTDAHCDSCNIAYDRDFARNVELTFAPAPAVRPVADGEFCLFGPMTTPHVKIQAAVEAGTTRTLEARLAAGAYRLRTLEIGGECDIRHAGGAFPTLVAAEGEVEAGPGADEGHVRLINRESRRRTMIVESRDWARDALSAHRATTMQAFRDLFEAETLGPEDQADVAQIALMFTDLKGSTAFYERVGDAVAYRVVRSHFGFLAEIVRAHDGAIVKTIGDAVMAAFGEPADAVRAALAIQNGVGAFNREAGGGDIVIKMGLHVGPCVAITVNGRLDYFGSTVNMAARLQGESRGDDIVLSEPLVADPEVAKTLAGQRTIPESRAIKGFGKPVSYRRLTIGGAQVGKG